MYKQCEVKLSKLRKEVDPTEFKFKTTEDIKPLESVIGQDRAVRAINFGLAMENYSYNIFVTGMRGTGRTTIVKDLLHKNAAKKHKPHDWLYVYNFKSPDQPTALHLPSSQAKHLIAKYHRLITNLKNALTTAFESENYIKRKTHILEESQKKKRDMFVALDEEASKLNIKIQSAPTGFQTIPMINEKPLDETRFQQLSSQERTTIEKNLLHVQKRLQNMIREATRIDRMSEEELEKLNEDTARFIVEANLADLREEYKEKKAVVTYLHDVIEDIVKNVPAFLNISQTPKEQMILSEQVEARRIDKYKINRVVDNTNSAGAPVIYEMNPTYNNLFGRIEKKSFMGYLYTDYTMIKAGSLLKANGGYLILDIEQLMRNPFVYDALKRALRNRCLVIEDVSELYGFMTSTALRPTPIPLNIKVIIIGQASAYHLLHRYDEDFRKIFKIRADFDYEVKANKRNLQRYVQFIARVVKEENLLPFDQSGVAEVVTRAYRLVDHQEKLSIRFAEIVRILRESSYLAAERKSKLVQAKDVLQALDEEKYRRNLSEEKIQDSIEEKTLQVDMRSWQIGQINGLAVYNLGDYFFGKPNKITATTYIGTKGIINIEREAKLSGKLHDKGILILSGYFAARFGDRIPLAFSASLTFEQSYGFIDGDSASCAELYALLSSLSQTPIYQGIAVTGSVNQKGEVQAIGGVNEKIEGFFHVCKKQRLTGKQGVIIPCANVKHLMLRSDVIEAIAKKRFQIWAVSHIEDGIRILTGIPAGQQHKDGSFTKGSIFARVQERITEFAKHTRTFRRQFDKSKKDEASDEEKEI
jgi:lon-related putative ATP-dependent protease